MLEMKTFEEIKENSIITISAFPPVVDGRVDFVLLEKVKSRNNYIDFSVVVSVQQKKDMKHTLSLKLVKVEERVKEYKTFELDTFSLDMESNKDKYDFTSIEVMRMSTDEFLIKRNFRFFFTDVPVLGSGVYALIVAVSEDKEFMPLAYEYFEVE